ncbi:unnamed protein product [Musa textilis]
MNQTYRLHAHLIKTLDVTALHSLLLLSVHHPSTLPYVRAAFVRHQPSLLRHSAAFPFNTLIRASAADPSDALAAFSLMRAAAVPPDLFTFPLLLKACSLLPFSCADDPRRHPGVAAHALAVKHGLSADLYVANTLVRLYSGFALLDAALQVFVEMPLRDAVSWSALISSLASNGHDETALDAFRLMQACSPDAAPDEVTMITVIMAVANLGAPDLAAWVDGYVARRGFVLTAKMGTALISMHSRCGSMDRAARVFDGMPQRERGVRAWTAMIVGYAAHGRSAEALGAFDRMVGDAGLRPDHVALIGVLTACSRGGLLEEGWRVFRSMERTPGMEPRMEHYGCMVDMMGRGGRVREAYDFVEGMPVRPNAVIWRTLLGACVSHGDVALAEQVKRRIAEMEPGHDGDYVLLSNAYGWIGRWEEKDRVRCAMRVEGVAKRPGCSSLRV